MDGVKSGVFIMKHQPQKRNNGKEGIKVKSKKTLILLIPLVVGIWGLIGYRVFKMTRSSGDEFAYSANSRISSDSLMVKKLIPLKLNYPDPFLKEQAPENANEKEFSSLFAKNPEPQKPTIKWPDFVFKGTVGNGHEKLGILEIDHQRTLVNEGFKKDNYQIQYIYNDSIRITCESDTKTFYK